MSHESEQALVANALTSAEKFEQICGIVSYQDFQTDELRLIFKAITAYRNLGKDVDAVMLGAALDRKQEWKDFQIFDSVSYLDELASLSTTFKLGEAYAKAVHAASVDRQLKGYAHEVTLVAEGEGAPDEKLGHVSAKLDELTESAPTGFITGAEAVDDALKNIIEVIESKNGMIGISTGFDGLDEISSGLKKSELIISAARPSMGKTALALNIATHVSQTLPVFIFSLEMSSSALAARMMSAISSEHFGDMQRGNLDKDNNLGFALDQIGNRQLFIDDTGGLHVDQMRMRARVLARKHKPGLIIVDYLTLLSGKGDNKTNEVGYISKSMKEMAKELDCPVWCLAQLNRGVENRADKRPLMSDLRDSGQIEQDADLILFNYLDEKYDDNSPRKGWLELIVAKNRNGETGMIPLEWQGHYQRFKNPHGNIPDIPKKERSRKQFDEPAEATF